MDLQRNISILKDPEQSLAATGALAGFQSSFFGVLKMELQLKSNDSLTEDDDIGNCYMLYQDKAE